MTNYWIFLGMMGSGKSTLGRLTANLTGKDFYDTDCMIETQLGLTISEIFKVYGEPFFRQKETETLKVLQPTGGILATGGGIILKPENWDQLRRLGKTIYLDIEPNLLIKRIRENKYPRPLLETDNWEAQLCYIYESRKKLYQKADLTIKLYEETIQDSANRLMDSIKTHEYTSSQTRQRTLQCSLVKP